MKILYILTYNTDCSFLKPRVVKTLNVRIIKIRVKSTDV